ncbi:hypothetical protein BGZ97_006593, partial [Linnemannia gamsii]
ASRHNEPNDLDGTSAANSGQHAMITVKDYSVDDQSDNNGINTVLDTEVRDWTVNGLAEHLTAATMAHEASRDNHNAEVVMYHKEPVSAKCYGRTTVVLNNYYHLHSGASSNNGNNNNDNPHISNYFLSYRHKWPDALNLPTVGRIYSRTNNNPYSSPVIELISANSSSNSSSGSETAQPALTFVRTPLNSRLYHRDCNIHTTNNDIIAPENIRSKETTKANSIIEAQQRTSLSFTYRGAQRTSVTNNHGSISKNAFSNGRDSYKNNVLVNINDDNKIISEDNINTASTSTSTMTRSYSTLNKASAMHIRHDLQDENTLGTHYSPVSAEITQSKFPVQKRGVRQPLAPIDINILINSKAYINSTGANGRSVNDNNSHSDINHRGTNTLQASNCTHYSSSRHAL